MRPDPDLRRDPAVWVRQIKPRTRLRRMLRRVRRNAPHLLLAALAAGVAYLLATLAFGAHHAMFAPVAAVVSIGLSAGQRLVRAIEISGGVVVGLVAADLLTRIVGAGTWQLFLAVLLAMSAAVALRGSQLMANQAAVAAVFVMVLVPLQDTPPLVRLGDAVIGGLVAVVLNAVLSPDPQRVAMATAEDLLARLAGAYRRLARAMETSSTTLAEETLEKLQALETAGTDLDTAIGATRERISLGRAETRLAQRRRLRAMEQVAARAGLMVTSARSTSRGVATLVRHGRQPDPHLVSSVEQLSQTLLALRGWVKGNTPADTVRESALRTASEVSALLGPGTSPAGQALAWQVRAACVDVLRVLGLSQSAAVAVLEARAGRSDRPFGKARAAEDTPE